MDWMEQIKAVLPWLPKNPDVIWSGWGLAVAVPLIGWFYNKFRKPKDASLQHDANKWFVENRHKLLARLQWELDERNKSLLLGQTRLHLDKDLSPDEVNHPHTRQDSICCTLERDGKAVETTDQPIVELFLRPDVGQRLAILGKPGSGKTVCLLMLIEHLLQRAEGDAHEPLPIIFECSEWDGRELVPWMAYQLHRKYEMQEDTARQMVQNRDILPLFDGLDELATEKQGDFVRCFNALPNDRPQIVCCRIKEYEYLQENAGDKLTLGNAVILRDIAPQRLKGHLLRAGLHGLWTLLEQPENEANPSSPQPAEEGQDTEQPQTLLELAQRPLFLGIMIAVAEKLRQGWKRQPGESWEDLLWRLYLNDCLAQRPPQPKQEPDAHDRKYTKDKSMHWLHCLARWMQKENKVALHIDELQPTMIQNYWPFGLFYMLIYILFFELTGLLSKGPIRNLALGVLLGLEVGLFSLLYFLRKIFSAKLARYMLVAMSATYFSGLVFALVKAQKSETRQLLAVMIVVGFLAAFFDRLFKGLKEVNIQQREKIHCKRLLHDVLRNSLLLFPVLTFISMIVFVPFIFLAEQIWDAIGLSFGDNTFYLVLSLIVVSNLFVLKAEDMLQRYLLRLYLWLEGQLPLSFKSWLETMHQRKVLQRVGGSYHFLHKQLQEYLAKSSPS